MATTKEIRESIVVAWRRPRRPANAHPGRRPARCRRARPRGRGAGPRVRAGLDRSPRGDGSRSSTPTPRPERLVPSLVDGLRAHLGTGTAYGDDVARLKARPIVALLTTLRPLFAWLARRRATPPGERTRFLVRSNPWTATSRCSRSCRATTRPGGTRRYPALVVLDAIIELSVVAETVDRLATAGRIPPLVVIGVGDPRREGSSRRRSAGSRSSRRRPTATPSMTTSGGSSDRCSRPSVSTRGRGSTRRRSCAVPRRRAAPAPGARVAHRVDGPRAAGPLGGRDVHALRAACRLAVPAVPRPEPGARRQRLVAPAHGRDTRRASGPRPDVFLSLGGEERTNRFNVIAGIPRRRLMRRSSRRAATRA